MNAPNLDDDYGTTTLMQFWNEHQRSRTAAAKLFPEKPTGYVRATRDLANYAANKATAMGCRLRGDIQGALQYEAICERIYRGLPDYARW